MQEIEIMR